MRALVAERISAAFAFVHRHAIVVSDISPNNLLLSFAGPQPEACFIDCDSMVFRGSQALTTVETGDWQIPPAFDEPPHTRSADAYKLGLLVLRLFARSHDARRLDPHRQHVPAGLHGLLERAISRDAPNRPPAGEWQLALRRALADDRLAQRCPGPPAPLAARPAAAPRRIGVAAGPARPLRIRAAPPARHASARRRAAPHHTPRGFALAWLITGLLLLALFAHLVQSAAVSASGGGFGYQRSNGFPSGAPYVLRGAGGYQGQGGGQPFAP